MSSYRKVLDAWDDYKEGGADISYNLKEISVSSESNGVYITSKDICDFMRNNPLLIDYVKTKAKEMGFQAGTINRVIAEFNVLGCIMSSELSGNSYQFDDLPPSKLVLLKDVLQGNTVKDCRLTSELNTFLTKLTDQYPNKEICTVKYTDVSRLYGDITFSNLAIDGITKLEFVSPSTDTHINGCTLGFIQVRAT